MRKRIPSEGQLRAITKIYKYPVVRVVWIDAASSGQWATVDEYLKRQCAECETVGFLIKNNKREIQLIQNISHSGNIADAMNIPKAWVKSIRILR